MNSIPSEALAVLSDGFRERMRNRRLLSAVFTTFKFEPGFFETEVLPVFFDIPLSHAAEIKRLQLEDALRSPTDGIAVYYDRNGLVAEGGPAKLDVRRYPVSHPTGVFHPKNVFVLVEDPSAELDERGRLPRSLLCASMSANLTRAGWWENVEVAHIEEIEDGAHTSLRVALIDYLNALVKVVEGHRANDEARKRHGAIAAIHEFLRNTTQRERRSSDGVIHPHFHDGDRSLPDFIADVAGRSVEGMCLEIVSPYFDQGTGDAPVTALRERFNPREMRLFLPRNDRGEALCTSELYQWIRKQDGIAWGTLPDDVLRLGKAADAKRRTVHAKVYRFFEPKRGGREICYVGSTNLTTAGCRPSGRGGNWETGFVVEVTRSGYRPDWWLATDEKRPAAFITRDEDEGTSTLGGTRLILRYRWDTKEASAYWCDDSPSPALIVSHGGVTVLLLNSLPDREWTPLDGDRGRALEQTLAATSLLEVSGEGPEPGLLLVQEEGMSHRPSLLLDLSPADILRYWSLLTAEQRVAFIEARAAIAGDDDPLVAKRVLLSDETTLFDRFAGIIHAFSCLENRIREALAGRQRREVDYRLFGRKYDSLGTLLDRLHGERMSGRGDPIEQYVVGLCAKQLIDELRRENHEYAQEHCADFAALEDRIGVIGDIRTELSHGDEEMSKFLTWFESWFLRRAAPVTVEAT